MGSSMEDKMGHDATIGLLGTIGPRYDRDEAANNCSLPSETISMPCAPG